VACGRPGRIAPATPGLIQCPGCGLGWARERPPPAEVQALYGNGYFRGGEYLDYAGARETWQRTFRRYLARLARYSASGRLLEIGCAHGFFLELARERWQVMGVDINPAACARAAGLAGVEVRCGEFLEMAFPPASFDVACLWATLEHLAAPDAYLARIGDLVRPGGVVALTTVDIGSLVARLRGRRWRQVHPPTHLFYFTRASLEALLARAGFALVFADHLGTDRSLDEVLYTICVRRHGRPGLHRRLQRLGLTRGSFYLNLFDTLFVVGRRR
jgi:SAM-dependent methyltransferase